jgi:NADP-dependent 3-hydroxy acid dehydrogenase YdfG
MRNVNSSKELLDEAEKNKISKEDIVVLALDVCDQKSVDECFKTILSEAKNIDVLVCN